MTKKQCPLGEACDLTTAWMAGAAKAQDQIKAQAAEIERLRGNLAKAVEAGKTMDDGCDCERCNQARTTLAALTGAQKDGN